MAVKYFCDRCDKEGDIWIITITIHDRRYEKSICQDCIEKLVGLLDVFFDDRGE